MSTDPHSPLPPDLAEFVAQRIASGANRSADEVIAQGVRLLRDQQAAIAEARRKIEEGWQASERGELIDSEAVFEQLDAEISRIENTRRMGKAG
jgi:antitoxin ParD1/3/4